MSCGGGSIGENPRAKFCLRSVTLQEGGVADAKAMTPKSPEPEPELKGGSESFEFLIGVMTI